MRPDAITKARESKGPEPPSPADVMKAFSRLEEAFRGQDAEELSRQIRLFARTLCYDHEANEVKAVFWAEPIVSHRRPRRDTVETHTALA